MPEPFADCRTSAADPDPATPASARTIEAHRAVRFDALLQLINEIEQRRTIEEVAQVVALRWKHTADVKHWRLVCVYGPNAVVCAARGREVWVHALAVAQLPAADARQWREQLPRNLAGEALAAERDTLPDALADPCGVGLLVLPILQGGRCVAMLSALGVDAPFDLLDRKFINRVGAVMAGRMVSILAEETLRAQLLTAERALAAERHAAILGRLVNGVAHELNTPIGVLAGACEALALLIDDDSDEGRQESRETLQLLRTQALRAGGIVRRLKQVSAVAQCAEPLPTALVETLQDIAVQQFGRGGCASIDIEGDDHLQLVVDRGALDAVITELLDNARLHAAGRAVRLHAWRGEAEVMIEVADGGPGLAPEVAERYGDPFFTTRQPDGHMGLGAYIVRCLARESLGATLTLTRADLGGLCVRLVFPAVATGRRRPSR